MFKILSAIFILTAQAVFAQHNGVGGTCESFVGPTPCDTGLTCCMVASDYGVCYDGACPSKFLNEGELCAGIAGPTDPCFPGLQCCSLGPDRSVCAADCSTA